MDDEQVQQDLRLMSVATASHITNQIAHDICVGTEPRPPSTAPSRAWVRTTSSRYRQRLAGAARRWLGNRFKADDKEHVLNALGIAATAMRARLGESLNSIQKLNRPLEQATTPSLEALQSYTAGYSEMGRANFWPLFRRLSAPLHSIQISRWLTSCSASRSTMPGHRAQPAVHIKIVSV